MKLRTLTEAGMQAFGSFLDELESEPTRLIPEELLTDAVMSVPVSGDVEIEKRTFANRLDAAKYLDEQFSTAELADIERDTGLWSWLALFYFDQLCPADSSDDRKPGERARYIPEATNFQRYYRHLLAGPYRIFRAHRKAPEKALAVLCQPLHRPGDLVEQLASRQELVTNDAIMEVATALYVDASTKKPKRGSQTKSVGAVRRLADVLSQFDVTWDLYSTQVGELLGILPMEFNRFQSST
jgi:hypothetical protein